MAERDLPGGLRHRPRRPPPRRRRSRCASDPSPPSQPVNPVAYLAVDGERDALDALDRTAQRVPARPARAPAGPRLRPPRHGGRRASARRLDAAVAALADFSAEVTFDRVHVLAEQPGPHLGAHRRDGARRRTGRSWGGAACRSTSSVTGRPDVEAAALLAIDHEPARPPVRGDRQPRRRRSWRPRGDGPPEAGSSWPTSWWPPRTGGRGSVGTSWSPWRTWPGDGRAHVQGRPRPSVAPAASLLTSCGWTVIPSPDAPTAEHRRWERPLSLAGAGAAAAPAGAAVAEPALGSGDAPPRRPCRGLGRVRPLVVPHGGRAGSGHAGRGCRAARTPLARPSGPGGGRRRARLPAVHAARVRHRHRRRQRAAGRSDLGRRRRYDDVPPSRARSSTRSAPPCSTASAARSRSTSPASPSLPWPCGASRRSPGDDGARWPGWSTLLVAANPWFWLAATSLGDFVWALGLVLGGRCSPTATDALLAGVLFGLAIGCRASIGAARAGLARRRADRAHRRTADVARSTITTAVAAGGRRRVLHPALARRRPDVRLPPAPSRLRRLGPPPRAAGRSRTWPGRGRPPASSSCSGSAELSARWRAGRRRWSCASRCSPIVGSELLFFRFPFKPLHLLPVVAGVGAARRRLAGRDAAVARGARRGPARRRPGQRDHRRARRRPTTPVERQGRRCSLTGRTAPHRRPLPPRRPASWARGRTRRPAERRGHRRSAILFDCQSETWKVVP